MHQDNMKITGSHMSASTPSQWPFLTGVDVRFFMEGEELILCQGNVFSYYFGLIGLVMCLILYKSRNYLTNMIWVVGWCFSCFPFYLIPRVMFLYHYLIPMMLGCCAFGASLELFPPKIKGITASCAIILTAFGFWLWVPLVTGKYRRDNELMFWNPKRLNVTSNSSNSSLS
ncbi:hypothetical protein TVAG_303190 [Trichomonas vaginalis G3]|uniref:Protein O-mannosyl-transferase C-terminal four TM domain-containing protein n=1 Tax=Trichomonas vaginalis (strain ATCC PRA-98 / G3) TaxID=412133 RepID=A2DR01_TRIV3|nr:dolichyl-phosphate-mannose-protein mannosyltransferase protein [Trichomonas vaginalis G3]EAY17100.1 hypothetical protein TVAG_303190 [Trichomonas vaginalis G3]KAI5508804.1 dolichyl-phosphate-mannose-protein mannosyltransferase protein [Trichomonas vaginalis G3]|eukprot:XP_001329323.1 hypothetical protein [Trichomonas vaginalis G3]